MGSRGRQASEGNQTRNQHSGEANRACMWQRDSTDVSASPMQGFASRCVPRNRNRGKCNAYCCQECVFAGSESAFCAVWLGLAVSVFVLEACLALISKAAASSSRRCIQHISESSASSAGVSLPELKALRARLASSLSSACSAPFFFSGHRPNLHICHQFLGPDLPPPLFFVNGLFFCPGLHCFQFRQESGW